MADWLCKSGTGLDFCKMPRWIRTAVSGANGTVADRTHLLEMAAACAGCVPPSRREDCDNPSSLSPSLDAPSPLLQDIFSLGCVIAELWLGEGRAFFDLGTLLAYRRGEYDPAKELAAVEPDIAELVMHMIQRAPGDTELWGSFG